MDVVTALAESMTDGRCPSPAIPRVVGGRYGLSLLMVFHPGDGEWRSSTS
jgi:hypothetical protein